MDLERHRQVRLRLHVGVNNSKKTACSINVNKAGPYRKAELKTVVTKLVNIKNESTNCNPPPDAVAIQFEKNGTPTLSD